MLQYKDPDFLESLLKGHRPILPPARAVSHFTPVNRGLPYDQSSPNLHPIYNVGPGLHCRSLQQSTPYPFYSYRLAMLAKLAEIT